MRAGGGHRKGGKAERLVAKDLSLWLTGGADYKQLVRSQASGGWKASQQGPDAWRHLGDLAPNGDEGERFRRVFGVEVKHHRLINFWTLWRTNLKKNTVATWWKKLKKEIGKSGVEGLHPMLVFRANSMPLMVAVPTWIVRGDERAVVVPWLGMSIMPFTEFTAYSPDLIFERIAEHD